MELDSLDGKIERRSRRRRHDVEHIDPRNSQQIWGIEGWGKEGITERLSVLFPAKIAGRSGYHTLTLIYTNKTGVDLRDIPELLLPPGSGAALGIKSGSYFVSYGIQHISGRTRRSRVGVLGSSARQASPTAIRTRSAG